MKWSKDKIRCFIITVVLFIILYMIGAAVILAQDYKASISGVYLPEDNGLGIKADYRLLRVGVYVSFSHGLYEASGYYTQPFFIKDHNRYSLGLTIPSGYSYFSLGVVYHTYGARDLGGVISEKALRPWSFEYGAGCSVGRFRAGFRFDVIRWEGCVDAGINLFNINK